MTTRYFAATDGNIIVFRGTQTRAYVSAFFSTSEGAHGWRVRGGISFSAKGPGTDGHSAVGITRDEYNALQRAKELRVLAGGGQLKYATSPQDSWVRVSDLEGDMALLFAKIEAPRVQLTEATRAELQASRRLEEKAKR